MVSLTSFLEGVLKRGGWDPMRGATLKTILHRQVPLRVPERLPAVVAQGDATAPAAT